METTSKPKITWLVHTESGLIPRTASMRGAWAYEAKCSCGWQTHIGGGTKRYVAEKIKEHKICDH